MQSVSRFSEGYKTWSGMIGGSIKLYDLWLKHMENGIEAGSKWFEKTLAGEPIEADSLLKPIHSSYEDTLKIVSEPFKDIPFAAEAEESLRKSVDSFPELQDILKKLLNEQLKFNANIVKLRGDAEVETVSALTQAMENGTIPITSWLKMIEAWGESTKRTSDITHLSDAIPRYKEIVDGSVLCAQKSLEILVSGLEIWLRIFRRINKSCEEWIRFAEMVSRNGIKPDEFKKTLAETLKQSLYTIVETRQSYTSIPKFIDAHAGFMKSVLRLFRVIVTIPFEISGTTGDYRLD